MKALASSKLGRSVGELIAWALAAHTNADQDHHTSAKTSIERPKPAQVKSRESNVVTWVTANTNTRSQRSSTGVVRRSSPTPSRAASAASFTLEVSPCAQATGSA